ncbi:MAG: mannose-1-phosphate guanylyltransferase [Kiritimatiellae bacterium]|nr:mannose-1-phosphate guanylyltransferase [Kiritimatiellia bacterium]
MSDKFYAVIMAGGKGERFWPLSSSKTPKQVLPLISDRPMIAMTVDYIKDLIPVERILIITNASLVDVTKDAVPELPTENIIGEPVGRDTAAACALGAALVKARCPDGAFCILTADHAISDLDKFRATISEGLAYALQNDVLMTIGIKPTFASTGFGYIEAGDKLESNGEVKLNQAVRFVEKPDKTTAESYLESGKFLWNSGMFMWSVNSLLKAFKKFSPEIFAMADKIEKVALSDEFYPTLREEYNKLGKISIDYAVMEKADNIVLANGEFSWSDIGTWPSLADHYEADDTGNVVVGTGEHMESADNIIVSKDRLTVLIGVSDLVVVQSKHATLICPKDKVEDIKAMVKQLHERGIYEELL